MHFFTRQILLFFVLWLPLDLVAQELSPRAYWPSPVGTRVVTVGYSYMTGDIIPDRSLPLTGVDSTISTAHFGFRQTIDLWGRTANLTVELPFSSGNTVGKRDTGVELERDYDGVGDIGITLSVNFLGAPAMTKAQFGELRRSPRPILGGSIKLVAPTGTYNPNRIVNVGANRWAMRAEMGYIKTLGSQWVVEAALGGWFFADNDDFFGVTKEQKPVVTAQGHIIHRFARGVWASLDINYYSGGRSTIGSKTLDDLQRDSKIGATIYFPLGNSNAVKLGYTNGSLNDSSEAFDIFLISYQQVF